MKNDLRQSFSLVEVLVFVTILGLFFVAAASITLVSLRNMKINEHKIIATHYAEELLSWLRSEKDADWNTFANRMPVDPAIVSYCINSTPSWPAISGKCATNDYSLDLIFNRDLTLSKDADPPSKFKVSIKVEWKELGNTYSVPLNTVFTIWE